MHHDVTSLSGFYYTTALGRAAQRSLQHALREIWPQTRGMTVAGYGFAAPFLRPFMGEAARTLCLMPARQGVMHWPHEAPNVAALVDSGRWPIPNGFIDRLIVAHAVETEGHLDDLFEEIGRVLAPEGKVIVIAPNRSGIWARADSTPFGLGRTFSYGQLEQMMENHDLTPVSRAAALYSPPSTRRFWLRSTRTVERLGRSLDAQKIAGALLVEATKRVYALPKGKRDRVRGMLQPVRVLPRPVGASYEGDLAAREETNDG